MHDEEQPSLITDNLVQKVLKRFHSYLTSSQVSKSVIYKIVTDRLIYRKLSCSRWVPKILMGVHKNKRLFSFFFTFPEQYSAEGDAFLSHIITCYETWVAYVTPE